jgi:hypothetical protein
VIRLASYGAATRHRDKLKLEFGTAPQLRDIYPQLAELRIEFDFEDGTTRAPSALAFAFFPAARGFFRYACPCHTCSGEFDLTQQVFELANRNGGAKRSGRLNLACTGQRLQATDAGETCPINARVRLSAVLHATEQPT